MHLFGGLTPQVIDEMPVRDLLALVEWADRFNKQQKKG